MKKCYPIVVLFLLCCNILSAQQNQNNSLVLGNQLFLDEKNIVANDNATDADLNNQVSQQLSSHYKAMLNKMEGLKNQTSAAMLVPSTGGNYDVKYYRLNLRINPDTSAGKYIRGNATIYFTTTTANVTVVSFDLATALASDSVYYHGAKLAGANISRATADLISITLPNIPVSGTLDSVTIYYKGIPPVTAGFSNGTGYVRSTHGASLNYVYTLSEPYSSYTWWPCKSFVVNDKADSADIIVSTPTTFKVASNGKLMYETVKGTNNLETYWKERYPISAYQVCLGVANYVQYPTVADTVVLSGTKMPVYNLIFPETNTTAAHTSLNRVPLMITTYSSLFGDYPFKNEKYGNYTFGFGGGMEHNTFSGESSSGVYTSAGNWDVLAHELAHQWWGASVTCASWHDISVNESFADFSEALLLEFAPSIASSVGTTDLAWRKTKKANSLNATYQSQATYVTDTSTIITIFSPSVYIYDRGGMIINMMRVLLGDTKFFQALKNYQADPDLKYGNAFIDDVRLQMENASGLNLTTFFNQWYYNTGYAKYSGATWNNFGNTIVMKLPQTTQSSALTHFDMPIPVRILGASAGQDTTVVIYDKNNELYYVNNGTLIKNWAGTSVQYNLSFTPTRVVFDSLSMVLASGTFTKSAAVLLDTRILDFTHVVNNNNVNLYWNIDNSFDYSAFEVERSTDGTTFEKIGTLKSADYSGLHNFLYTDYNLASGKWYYRIKVIQKNGNFIYTNILVANVTGSQADYVVSPNPASDFIVISSSKSGKADIQLYSAAGKIVKEIKGQQINGGGLKVAVSNLSAGNYFVKIITGEESITKPVLIIR